MHSWVFDSDYDADWLALVDDSRDRAWLFEMGKARELAQQKPHSGKWRIYRYPDNATVGGNPRRESDMTAYEIDSVVGRIKNVEPSSPVRVTYHAHLCP